MLNETIVMMLTQLLKGQDQIVARIDRIEAQMAARVDQVEAGTAVRKNEKLWFSPEELAEALHRKPYTCREWARKGRIHAEKVEYSNKWRIHKDEVARLENGGGLLPETAR